MELSRLFSKKTSSSSVAKNRLKLLLVHDRADCSPEVLEMIKNDIVKVIAKYFDFDETELDINISRTNTETTDGEESPVLYANIPILSMKNRANE